MIEREGVTDHGTGAGIGNLGDRPTCEVSVPKRRPMGSLESEVLAALWANDRPMSAGDVLDAAGVDVAYTTVMTILSRLWQKGLVDRERAGRAYLYTPRLSEADLAATRMYEQLARAGDREAALKRFVGALSRRDERLIRKVLDGFR